MRQGTQLFAFIGYKKTEKTGGNSNFKSTFQHFIASAKTLLPVDIKLHFY